MSLDLRLYSVKLILVCLFSVHFIRGCSMSPREAFEKGFELYDNEQKREAYPYLRQAYESGINNPELAVRLAFCLVAVDKNPSGAIEILSENAKRFPDYSETYYQLGLIAHNFGSEDEKSNLRQAIYFACKAVELAPVEWSYNDNLGSYYYLAGELDSALVYFKAASGLNPSNEELIERIKKVKRRLAQ